MTKKEIKDWDAEEAKIRRELRKKKLFKNNPLTEAEIYKMIEQTGDDRMLRYSRQPACPKCDARPAKCLIARGKYSLWNCRQCGYRWEIGGNNS